MVIGTAGLTTRLENDVITTNSFQKFLCRYFYLCMSLLLAALVIIGFSRTVNTNLFHGNPPRPLLLWVHGAAFSMWVVFFIVQSSLVRARQVSVHRLLGWFGATLAAVMVALGITIAIVMARFDARVLHQTFDSNAFLSIPFVDMVIFGTCIALAIYWKKRPEYHRRLILCASVAQALLPVRLFPATQA